MRSLKPIQSEEHSVLISSDVKAELDSKISALQNGQNNIEQELDDLQEVLNKPAIEKDVGVFNSVKANTIEAGEVEVRTHIDAPHIGTQTISVGTRAEINQLNAENLNAKDASIPELNSTYVESESVKAEDASIDYITAESVDSDSMTAKTFVSETAGIAELSSDHIISTDITTKELNVETFNLEDLTFDDAKGKSIELEGDIRASVSRFGKQISQIEQFTNQFDNSKEFVVLNHQNQSDPGYVELPAIRAGWYRIVCTETQDPESNILWSLLYYNASNSPIIHYWRSTEESLTKFIYKSPLELYPKLDHGKLYIETYSNGYLYWKVDTQHNESGAENEWFAAPKTYDYLPVVINENDFTHDVKYKSRLVIMGQKNALSGVEIDGQLDAAQMNVAKQIIDEAWFANSIYLPNVFDNDDGTIIGYSAGTKNQYVSLQPTGHGNDAYPKWTEPYNQTENGALIDPNGQTGNIDSDGDRLVTERTLSNWNGDVAQTEVDDEGNESTTYIHPITKLGNDTTVYGDFKTEGDTTVEGSFKSKHIYDGTDPAPEMPDDSLVIAENDDGSPKLTRKRDFTVDGTVTPKYDPLAVQNSDANWTEDEDGLPLVYNNERDAIETSDSLKLNNLEVDNLKVNNNADIGNDLRVAGDLYVSGTSHIVDEEHISTTGDTLTLRQNAETGLMPGQVSGVVINNYKYDEDGNPVDLALVTDEDGTLRVGTGTGQETVYENIAWNETERKWFKITDDGYEELETQPQGTVTEYSGKTEEDPYTKYDSVTFTVIDKTSLQPLLTRDEDDNIPDNALLKYDKANSKAVAVELPTINGSKLQAEIKDGKVVYSWGGTAEAGIFRFPDYDAYQTALGITEGNTGYIPDGSLIVIDGDVNYLRGPEGLYADK